jgi:hypothetical protein
MGNLGESLDKKRSELGLNRHDELIEIQALLDSWYPNITRAKSINNGVLLIVIKSSSVASDLRLRQIELIKNFNNIKSLRFSQE